LNGRDFVGPEDIRAIIHDVLRHRIIPSYEATAEGKSTDDIIDELLKQVAIS
jgi:MoxR-like ATPase